MHCTTIKKDKIYLLTVANHLDLDLKKRRHGTNELTLVKFKQWKTPLY